MCVILMSEMKVRSNDIEQEIELWLLAEATAQGATERTIY